MSFKDVRRKEESRGKLKRSGGHSTGAFDVLLFLLVSMVSALHYLHSSKISAALIADHQMRLLP